MEQDYSKREIDDKFTEIQSSLDRIENQTTRTNGKVAELQAWQSFMKGGLAVLTTLVLPVFLYIIYTYFKFKQ